MIKRTHGNFLTRAIRLAVAVSLALLIGLAAAPGPARAQGNQPPANPLAAPAEADMLRALKSVQGIVSIPDQKEAVLEQPGRDWRESLKGTVHIVGSWLILGMTALLIVFYMIRGSIPIEGGRSGRTVERFTGFERFVHWMTASAFVILALTGLNIAYGRFLLLPILGPSGFSSWSLVAKYSHNFCAFPFMLGLALIFVQWVAQNIPNSYDGQWLAQGGGLFTRGSHPPAGKFNAGQKIIFWSVVIGGAAISYTGIFLLFPFSFGDIQDQQTMALGHSLLGTILTAVIIAHIYIGTLGMEGAWDAMYTGHVDEQWAREHHAQWVAGAQGHADD